MWAALQRVLHTFWYSPTGVDFGDGFLAYWYCFLWFYGNPSHFLKQWLWEFGHSRYDFDEMFCHAHMRTNWKTFGALWNLASIWWRTFDSMPTICHDVHHGVCEKPLRNWVCETLIIDLVEWNLILSYLNFLWCSSEILSMRLSKGSDPTCTFAHVTTFEIHWWHIENSYLLTIVPCDFRDGNLRLHAESYYISFVCVSDFVIGILLFRMYVTWFLLICT